LGNHSGHDKFTDWHSLRGYWYSRMLNRSFGFSGPAQESETHFSCPSDVGLRNHPINNSEDALFTWHFIFRNIKKAARCRMDQIVKLRLESDPRDLDRRDADGTVRNFRICSNIMLAWSIQDLPFHLACIFARQNRLAPAVTKPKRTYLGKRAKKWSFSIRRK
jgi:hypothetical protein